AGTASHWDMGTATSAVYPRTQDSSLFRASDKRQAERLPCRSERGSRGYAFPAGKTACQKGVRDGKTQSRGRYEVGAGYEQYPQPSRRGRLQRLDLQLIPAYRELPLSTDGGFSFSAGVQKVGVQKVIKSAV